MSTGRKMFGLGALVAAVAMMIAPQQAKAVSAEMVSVDAGVDIVSSYYFRGIAQENAGLIVQPSIAIGFDVWSFDISEGNTFSFSPYVATWLSLHDAGLTGTIYEADYTFGVAIGMPAGFYGDLSYIFLTNPAGGAEFAQEIDVLIGYDASALTDQVVEGLTWDINILFAFETSNGSDGLGGPVGDQGIYWQFNTSLGYTFMPDSDFPLTVSVGATVGLSISNYYETVTAGGVVTDNTFGFAAFDLGVSTPLSALIPTEKYGAWELHGGVTLLIPGNGPEAIGGPATAAVANGFGITDGSEDVQIIGTVGIGVSF